MKFLDALKGFVIHLSAEGYSKSTISGYALSLRRVEQFLGNPDVAKITPNKMSEYMAWLRDEYIPHRSNGDTSPISGSGMQNDWKAIRSFFNWASKEFKLKARPDANLKLPRYMPEEIIPFTQDEVQTLLKAAEYTKEASPSNRKSFRMKRATATRDISILLILLDTGLRVGELSRLQKRDINLDTGEIVVKPFGSGTKSRARTVYLGKSGRRALWKFMAGNEVAADELVFQMETNSIRWLLRRLGERAGIKDVHPHRFRHTFAIEFLRNGGDVFSLQRLLGHSSLEMVRRYLTLADADAKFSHQKASPADKWHL